jgi:UPF0042 nucleotide-binding protein
MRSSDRRGGEPVSASLEVVVITGLSGSGRSTAIHVLEDLGFYCIDNLPVVLVPRVLELCTSSLERITRIGLGIDLRERQFFAEYPRVLDELRRAGYRLEVLFFDASDEVLVRRFSETRRPHPLGGEAGPLAGIQHERAELVGLRERADRIIDTSAVTVHQLREELQRLYRGPSPADTLTVLLVSFGYKFGLPTDADMVLDARFLTNPFFVDELRAKTGCDAAVAAFVIDRPEAQEFLRLTEALLDHTLALHRREGRSYVTLAVGCTGGRHRSVALVERLAQDLARRGCRVQVQHRDMRR